jgi:hypothetical protein
MLQGIAERTAQDAAELRGVLAKGADPGRARAGVGLLAAEFGLRQYDAVHEWALWALDQIPEDAQAVAAPTVRGLV